MTVGLGGTATGTPEQVRNPILFAFPLKDKVNDPDEASLFKVLEAEYAARYLEQLGANPSQAAQDIVRKALPLTADCLQVKLKAAGHKDNEVLVVPPPYQVEILPIQEADPQDVVRLGFVGDLGEAAHGTPDSLQDLLWDQPLVSRSFRQVASKFLDKPRRSSTTGNKHSAGSLNSSQQSLSMSASALQQSIVEPRAGRVGIFCNLVHIQKELSRPFSITSSVAKRIQLHFGQSVTEWYNALPKAARGGHGQLKEQDIQNTTDELVSEEVVSLAVTAVTFLYYEFVVSSPAFPSDQLIAVMSRQNPLVSQKHARQHKGLPSQTSLASNWDAASTSAGSSITGSMCPAHARDAASIAANVTLQAEAQQNRLFSIVQLWAQRSRVYSQTKWATNFARPVVILSLRALVDKVFSDAFPLWMTSAHGIARLQDMDAQLLHWFDPHGFNSSISLLQSLPTAAKEGKPQQHGQPVQCVHKHKKQHFTGTTSLVGTFLSEPRTAACRRLQHRAKGVVQQDMHMVSVLSQSQKGVMMKAAEKLLLQST